MCCFTTVSESSVFFPTTGTCTPPTNWTRGPQRKQVMDLLFYTISLIYRWWWSTNKGSEEEVNMVRKQCRFQNVQNISKIKCFMRKEMHATCLLDLKDTHNEFCWETLNMNRNFVCLQEQPVYIERNFLTQA